MDSTNVNQSEQAAIQDGNARYHPVISGRQLSEVLSSDDRSLAARARRLPTNKRIVMLAGLICDWLWNSSECTFASRRVSQFKRGTMYPTHNRLCKLRPQFPGLNYDSWTEGLYFKVVPIVMLTRLTSHGVPRNAFILRGSLPLSLWDL
jgi:hypothetical protein